MLIRNIEQNDMPQLALLYEQFWGDLFDVTKMKEEFLFIAKENRHIILVAECNEKIIASENVINLV